MTENKTGERNKGFERRQMLKLLTSVPAAALIPLAPFAPQAARAMPQTPVAQRPPAGYQPKVFTAHEWKTMQLLCERILPADQTSGSATEAGVPEFIDDWLHLKQGIQLAVIRGGLTWLDIESNRSFGHDFAECSSAGQKQMLDRIAYPASASPEDAGAVAFFNTLRDLVVSGFFTSEMGIRDLPYLGNEPQTEWKGCPSPVLAKLALAEKKQQDDAVEGAGARLNERPGVGQR